MQITRCLEHESLLHPFIHSRYFYSASSSPLLLRQAPDCSIDTVSELACYPTVSTPGSIDIWHSFLKQEHCILCAGLIWSGDPHIKKHNALARHFSCPQAARSINFTQWNAFFSKIKFSTASCADMPASPSSISQLLCQAKSNLCGR